MPTLGYIQAVGRYVTSYTSNLPRCPVVLYEVTASGAKTLLLCNGTDPPPELQMATKISDKHLH
eukprot:1280301-Amphidinium_carterae.1